MILGGRFFLTQGKKLAKSSSIRRLLLVRLKRMVRDAWCMEARSVTSAAKIGAFGMSDATPDMN
jgi:hypothetical protein